MANNGRGNRVQFEAHLRIVPERGEGKRFEIHRSRQAQAHLVHRDLVANFANGNIAQPGGGQSWGIGEIDGDQTAWGFSSHVNGAAVKPQFGETPDTITVVGFFDHTSATAGTANDTIPYNEKQIIHSGTTHTRSSQSGPAAGAPGWNDEYNPSGPGRQVVFALKEDLEAAITSIPVEILWIEVMGVRWGQGGHHFPLTGT